MSRLVADRQLYNKDLYGLVVPGQEFDCDDERVVKELLNAGVVHRPAPPQITYDTKVITSADVPSFIPTAPEVSARLPFRHGTMPDAEPAPVVAESDRLLPPPNVPEPRPVDTGRRGRRARSGS